MKWGKNEKAQTSVSRFGFDCWNGKQKSKSKLVATCLSLTSLWKATLIGKETTQNRTLPGGEDQQPGESGEWAQVNVNGPGCALLPGIRDATRVTTGWWLDGALLVPSLNPPAPPVLTLGNSAFFYTPPAHHLSHACLNHWVPRTKEDLVRWAQAWIQQHCEIDPFKCINFM